jgi:hypothetical protein
MNLGLEPSFDNVKGTCHRASESASCRSRQEFQLPSDVAAVFIPMRPTLTLLVEHELEG